MSSHVLNDVEAICNRIILLSNGAIKEEGKITEILAKTLKGTEVSFIPKDHLYKNILPKDQFEILNEEVQTTINLKPTVELNSFLQQLISQGHQVLKVMPHNENLEDYFIRIAGEKK